METFEAMEERLYYNMTSSGHFILYESSEYYVYVLISLSGIFISLGCLLYILKKLILNWLIQAILIFMSIHETIGFTIFFVGVMLSYEQDYTTCALIFVPLCTFLGTTILLCSIMSIIR